MSNKKIERYSLNKKTPTAHSGVERKSSTSLEKKLPQSINETLIKKISNGLDPLKIISLNFHAKSSTLERIEKIDGLEKLVNLEELNLSYNMISRIENLENCLKLRELNLADNNIRRIENIEKLVHLESLNLNGNLIAEIPQNIEALKNLKTLKMARNKIKDISAISNISLLPMLNNLGILDNPICKTVSYVEVCLLFSRNLMSIDAKKIDHDIQETLKKAVSNVDFQAVLNEKSKEIEDLKQNNENILKIRENLMEENNVFKGNIENLEQELSFKSLQYEHKVKEMAEKIAKISELEQELSHYKIELLFTRYGKNLKKTDIIKSIDEIPRFFDSGNEGISIENKDLMNSKNQLLRLEKQGNFLKNLKSECEKDLKLIGDQGITLKEKLKEKEHYMQQLSSQRNFLKKPVNLVQIYVTSENSDKKKSSCIQSKISITTEKIEKTRKLIDKLHENQEIDKDSRSPDVLEINEKIVLSNKLKKLEEKLVEYQKMMNFEGKNEEGQEAEIEEITRKSENDMVFEYNQMKGLKEKLNENEDIEKEIGKKLENVEKELKKIDFEKEQAEKTVEKLFSKSDIYKDVENIEKNYRDFYVQTEEIIEKSKNISENAFLILNQKEYIDFCEEIEELYENISRFIRKKQISPIFSNEKPLDSSDSQRKSHIFQCFKDILTYFKKKQENIDIFEQAKLRFVSDFERETHELTENWRIFDKKKLEYKEKLSEEKALLYKELDGEYKKLADFKAKLKKTPQKDIDMIENSEDIMRNLKNSNDFSENYEEIDEKLKELMQEERNLQVKIDEKSKSLEIIEESLKQNLMKLQQDEEKNEVFNNEIAKKTKELLEITRKTEEKKAEYAENELLLSKYEAFLQEYNAAKEIFKKTQSESLSLEKKLVENRHIYEESILRITLQEQNHGSLKKHIEAITLQIKEKQGKLVEIDNSINEKQHICNEFEKKHTNFLIQQNKESEDIEKLSKKKSDISEEIEKINKKTIEIEKNLQIKELTLNNIKREIDEKALEFNDLNELIMSNQSNYKSLLKENKEILEKLKLELREKDIEQKEMMKRIEEFKNMEEKLLENLKEMQNSIKSAVETEKTLNNNLQRVEKELNISRENLRSSQENERHIHKKLENLKNIEMEYQDKTEEMERYLSELRIEQGEMLEKMRVLRQKEDELYVIMALNGESLDKKSLQRIKELTESHYLLGQLKTQLNEKENIKKKHSFITVTEPQVSMKSPGKKCNSIENMLFSSERSRKNNGDKEFKVLMSKRKGYLSPGIKEEAMEDSQRGFLSSGGKKKQELSMKINEAEKEISNLKKKLEMNEDNDF